MADNPLTISNADINGVLKRVYSGFRNTVFPLITPLMANIKKGKPGGPENLRWGGEGAYFDVVMDRPVGMVASDEGYLPHSHAAREKQGSLGIKRLYVRRKIDGLAIRGTDSKEKAYVSLAKKILAEMRQAAELGMQEIGHGDGRGIKGLIVSVTSSTVIVVSSPYGVTGAGQGALLLDVGMLIAILDTSAADAVLGRAKITAITVSGDNVTLTLDDTIAGSAAATDKIVACTDSDTSFNAYPNGLINITNRSSGYNSIHGLSAATYTRWNAVQMVAGTDTPLATQPTENDIWRLIKRVGGVSGIDAKSRRSEFLLMTTPGIEEKLIESFLGQRRFDSAATVDTIKGGFNSVKICGLDLVSDFWCPVGTVYLIHLPSLFYVEGEDWGMVEYEGAGPWRWVDGRDAFETSYKSYLNLGTGRRNAHGSIIGYDDTFRASFVQ